jgi:chromosome segregation ATPase
MAKQPLTIEETRRALGVSDSSVRRMLRAGLLKEAGRQPGGRILVDPQSVEAAAVQLGRAELAGSEVRRELGPSVSAMAETINALLQRLGEQEERMQARDQRMIELAEQLGQTRAEARLLPQVNDQLQRRTEVLESELDRASRELQEAQARIAALEQQLAQAGEQVTNQPSEGKKTGFLDRLFGRD